MKIPFFLILIILLPFKVTFAQNAPKGSPLVLPQIQVIPVGDTQANRQYELYIELPEGYTENPDKQYPVLYYTDAIWHMEVLSACAEYVLTEAILVGISWQTDINRELIEEHGAHVSRYRDYTVKASGNPDYQAKYQFGKADEHLAFIRNDVIPYVEANYRADPGNRSYFGYSASGLFGAYILMAQPETFKHYLLGSPSLKGDMATLKQVGSDLNEGGINANVFISHGDQEEETGSYVREFVELLKNRNDVSLNISYEVMDGNHQTAFPTTGVQGVKWLAQVGNDHSGSPVAERYFGEEPPGLAPKRFDPKIVSPEGLFESGSFSPDGKEFYFTRKNGRYEQRTFFVIRFENGSWGKEVETDIRWPKFTADGNKIYSGKYFRERTDTGWSEPKSQGDFLKDQAHGITLAANGTYYFGYYTEDDRIVGAIRYSHLIDGRYEDPIAMNADINKGTYIAHPYIAPDESYLIWDAEREEGYGDSDLYISFRAKDGYWGPAINMGDGINTEGSESSGHITYDGKYLFFSRGQWETKADGTENWVGKSYWVDAQVIELLRPKD